MTLRELLTAQYPEREDLVGPWLRQGESAMIWAAPATGKALLTLTIGLMVAGGGSALGWNSPKPRRVLLVDGEMAKEDLQERARWLMDTIDDIDRQAVSALRRGVPLHHIRSDRPEPSPPLGLDRMAKRHPINRLAELLPWNWNREPAKLAA